VVINLNEEGSFLAGPRLFLEIRDHSGTIVIDVNESRHNENKGEQEYRGPDSG
jgi:hypothetical protein